MSIEELSNEFDVLLKTLVGDSLKFDEYEKSIFLTSALETVIKGLYNGTLTLKSFEETEELRRSLDSLIKTEHLEINTNRNNNFYENNVDLPPDVWVITQETLVTDGAKYIMVVPTTQDDYHRIINNPFRGPNSRRALRLDNGNKQVTIISKLEPTKYIVKYLSQPKPIILTDLNSTGLTINGESTVQDLNLNPMLYRLIIELAISYAIKGAAALISK